MYADTYLANGNCWLTENFRPIAAAPRRPAALPMGSISNFSLVQILALRLMDRQNRRLAKLAKMMGECHVIS